VMVGEERRVTEGPFASLDRILAQLDALLPLLSSVETYHRRMPSGLYKLPRSPSAESGRFIRSHRGIRRCVARSLEVSRPSGSVWHLRWPRTAVLRCASMRPAATA